MSSNWLLSQVGQAGHVYHEHIATKRPDENLTATPVDHLQDAALRPFFIRAQPFGPGTTLRAEPGHGGRWQ
jgi:hypothetical protein